MIANEFGKLIEDLIQISGQKNYSLAMELGYDISYISKWINLSKLPTPKNIYDINKKIAKFIVNSSSEDSINSLMEYLNLEVCEDEELKDRLIKNINDELNKSFSYSYNKLNRKSLKKKADVNNSCQIVNPSFGKTHMEVEVHDFLKTCANSNIIVLCDLFFLTKSDKIKLSGIASSLGYEDTTPPINIKYIFSFNENTSITTLDIMLFINMVISSKRIKTEFYICDFITTSFIMTIKDKFTQTKVFYNKKCLNSTASNDTSIVNEMYEMLNEISETESNLIFTRKSSEEIMIDQDYINHIIDGDLKMLMGEISELFMPSDLFLELGRNVLGNNEDILAKLQKIDTILQSITYKFNIDVVLYESVLKEYIYNGNITFFNKPTSLSVEQRKKHLSYMKYILEQNKNINIKLVNNLPLDNYKNDEKMSIYISRNSSILKEKFNNDIGNDYLLTKDYRVCNMFRRFFDDIWKECSESKDKQYTLEIISSFEKYNHIIEYINSK